MSIGNYPETSIWAIPGWNGVTSPNAEARVNTPDDGSLSLDIYTEPADEPSSLITWQLFPGTEEGCMLEANPEYPATVTTRQIVDPSDPENGNVRGYLLTLPPYTLRKGSYRLKVFKNARYVKTIRLYCQRERH